VLDEFDDEWMHPQPFLSTLMSGCIESRRDISAGGALHTNVGIRCTGLSAVADSLMALRSLVFDQHVVSLEELDKALSEDFAESESLRQTLINRAAKFGNDEDSVDLIARSIGEHFCLEVMKHRGIRGGKFKPGLFSYYDFTWTGRHCGALPSGRKARQPFANGVTPMRGMDRLGPTAMLSSASKLNYALSPNANTLDMKLSSQTMNGEDGIDRLSKLVKAYFDMGGMQLQLSVLSAEDLLDAKRNPQEHQNLLVRVAGWSAFFVTLSDEAQNEIISRSEHSLV
jgi:formate C-acetyltransferase